MVIEVAEVQAADSEIAAAILASAGRHVESARRTTDADPEAAYALAYVVDAVRALFPGAPRLISLIGLDL